MALLASLNKRVPKIMPNLCGCCEGAVRYINVILDRCIGEALIWSCVPCFSQSGKWLLICGKVKATHKCCFKNTTPSLLSKISE